MKEQNIKKNIKKNSTWGVKLIRNWPCDKISCERWENWMCKNALIIDSGGENKTKYSRIFILVLYWLKFDKTKKIKAKDRWKSIWKQEIKYFLCCATKYIEDITRWREDMNFMFEWQEQYLTSEHSEQVRYYSCHENIKFISSSQRVMFFLLYGETNSTKAKGGNRDVIERQDTHKGDIWKIRHSGPGWSVWNLWVV